MSRSKIIVAFFILCTSLGSLYSEETCKAEKLHRADGISPAPVVRIDGLIPSVIPAGSPDTRFELMGTALDQVSGVYVLDKDDNWVKLPMTVMNSTRAKVMVPASYLSVPRFMIFSTEEADIEYAQSLMVYSPTVAQATTNSNFAINVGPIDIGGAPGPITITGSGFVPGMRVVVGRANVAGVILRTKVESDSYLEADTPVYIPGNDLFIAVLSADGKTRSASVGVESTFPYPESDFTQNAPSPNLSDINQKGLRLMKQKNYLCAAVKFVEAARVDWSYTGISVALKTGAQFANNAGFAFFKAGRYEESVFWVKRAIEIDPQRAVAYLNLGDTYVRLHSNADARHAYAKYFDLAPNSKSAPDVKKKLKTR